MCSHVGKCNRKSVVKLVILTVCVLGCFPLARGLTNSDLYPFGTSASDYETDRADDGGSNKILLKNPFKFFGKSKSSLFVNNNGLITFDAQLSEYKPKSFPLQENIPLIAPFWADVDVSRDWSKGNIWYRQEYDPLLLNRASQEIQSYFITQRNFHADWLFIVTWDNVGFYGASGQGRNKKNTFQAVLVKNEKRSFVIFNYLRVEWTTGSNSLGEPTTGLGGSTAQAGFNAGDQRNYYSIEGAQTPGVINLTLTSNVGIPGKWVFQVDGNNILDIKCSHAEQIYVFPRAGSMFGGEEIRISGPCFSSAFTILARIKETNDTFQCRAINDISASCIMPSIFRTGQVTIEVNPYEMGWNYSSAYHIENVAFLTPKITRHNPDWWVIQHNVTMSWNLSLTPSNPLFLDILAYQNTNDSRPSFVTVHNEPIDLLDLQTPTNSSIAFTSFILDGMLYENMTSLVLRIRYNTSAGFSSIWSDVFPVRWPSATNAEKMCQNWMKSSLPVLNETESTCPCTLRQASRDTGRFFVDPLCNLQNDYKDTNCMYNRGAAQCFRRTLHSLSVSGETCCYNSAGELLDARDTPHAGGTRSLYHIHAQGGDIVPFFSYFKNDLVPFVQCCHYAYNNSMCQRFLKLRPPTTCQAYTPPTPAQAAGDPHLTSLDRKDYTFNGIGDFVLLQDVNSSMVVQVRAIQTKDTNGLLQNASVFSAIAMQTRTSDKIEIYKTIDGVAEILVNNDSVELVETTSNFNGVNLERVEREDSNLNILVVFENEDLSISVDVSEDLLNVLVMISGERYKGQIRGLLGNFNGDDNDDFITRQSEVLPSDASMEDLHFKFGMTWEVQSDELLFTRQNTESNAMNYAPIFLDDIGNPDFNFTVVLELCGDNKQCQYDYSVTKNENIAKGTMQFIEKFKEIESDVQKVVRCPFLEVPTNGNRSVSGYSVGANASFWCLEGFQLIQGVPFVVCREDGEWSGGTPMCVEKLVEDSPISSLVIYIASGSGALIAVVVIAIVLMAFMKCRRKPKPETDPEINGPIFENPIFLESLSTLGNGGAFKIPRPTYVDPNLLDDYFF